MLDRSTLVAYLQNAGLSTARAVASLAEFEKGIAKKHLEQAVLAIQEEKLVDDTGTPEDDAYNDAIEHAAASVRKLIEEQDV